MTLRQPPAHGAADWINPDAVDTVHAEADGTYLLTLRSGTTAVVTSAELTLLFPQLVAPLPLPALDTDPRPTPHPSLIGDDDAKRA